VSESPSPALRHAHSPVKHIAGVIFLGITRSELKCDHSLAVSASYTIPD
jgi:hypothetical protein